MNNDERVRQLHKVQAVSGLELAACVRLWQELHAQDDPRCRHNGSLGPLAPLLDEDPHLYGERIALGLWQLMREV